MADLVVWIQYTAPFWFAFGPGLYAIRVFADYFRIRFKPKGVHLHHFLLGFPLSFISWILFSCGRDFEAMLTAGIATALWASETKELILSRWSK